MHKVKKQATERTVSEEVNDIEGKEERAETRQREKECKQRLLTVRRAMKK